MCIICLVIDIVNIGFYILFIKIVNRLCVVANSFSMAGDLFAIDSFRIAIYKFMYPP